MIDFKNIIAKAIAQVININQTEIKKSIEKPKGTENGDYSFPCFRLAKELKKAPPVIASEIKENIQIDEKTIEKVEIAGGYLNFYVNKNRSFHFCSLYNVIFLLYLVYIFFSNIFTIFL